MKFGALASGGKDSIYSAYYYVKKGWDLKCLISIESKNIDSYMFHTPNISLVSKQAEAIGVPLLVQQTQGEKEVELKDLKIALQKAKDDYGIEAITVGAIFSDYQNERVKKICEELKIEVCAPLWHMDQEKVLRLMLQKGFKILIVKTAALGLDASHLKIIDEDMVQKLIELYKKYKINIAGEGGEYETFVLDCPFFKKQIQINDQEIKDNCLVIKSVSLIEKS